MVARVCASAVITYKNKYLICKTPPNLGVYPDAWGIPGGGMENDETMTQALSREVWEEVGLRVSDVKPLLFSDEYKDKISKDGVSNKIYMIFLVFTCRASSDFVVLGDEFVEYAWVSLDRVLGYDLNWATRKTFEKLIDYKQLGLVG